MSIVLLTTIATVGTAYAGTPAQNYNVGYGDGCADGKTNSANAFNSHSNAAHHSQSYINGYNAGYNSCSNLDSVNLANTNTVSQTQGASQGQGFCVTVFSGCTQTLGQSQGQQQN